MDTSASRRKLDIIVLGCVLFVLLVVQSTLANMGIPILGGLHGVNALVMIGLGGYLTGSNWAFGSRTQATQAPG